MNTTTIEMPVGPAQPMVLNMGPQHPSTHGVLRVILELDGEIVLKADPVIGYLHTGIEKSCEDKTYSQCITLTDRIDYLAPLSNNLGFCLAAEKLIGIEVPKRAQYIRVLLTELTRITSHLVWLGTHAIDLGAMSVFLYSFREREEIMKIYEYVSGQRMMTSYFRIGGLALEPPPGWLDRVQRVAGPRASATSALRTPSPWAFQALFCAPAAWPMMCARLSPTRATTNSISTYRRRRQAIRTPGTRYALLRFERASRLSARPWKRFPRKAPSARRCPESFRRPEKR
jgi:hypothetical protein